MILGKGKGGTGTGQDRQRKADGTSQGYTVLIIKELLQAKQNHDNSLNPGHMHFFKTVGCYDNERVR